MLMDSLTGNARLQIFIKIHPWIIKFQTNQCSHHLVKCTICFTQGKTWENYALRVPSETSWIYFIVPMQIWQLSGIWQHHLYTQYYQLWMKINCLELSWVTLLELILLKNAFGFYEKSSILQQHQSWNFRNFNHWSYLWMLCSK